MNKFVNILLILLSLPAMVLTIFVGFDLPVEFLKTTGGNLPYRGELFLVFSGVILLVGARRSVRRWMGMRMVNQVKRFQWNEVMSAERIRRVSLYLMLEFMVHLFVALAIYVITPQVWPISVVIALLGIDHLVFSIVGRSGNKFRVGITSKAIVFADRDVKIAYFSGLRKVSTQQQSLFFDYIKELQISAPIDSIAPQHRASFRETIATNVDRNKVHFSEGFKEF